MNLLCESALISCPCRAPSATHMGPLHCIFQAPKMKGGELPAPELHGWIGAPAMTTAKLCMTHPLFLTPWKLNNESEALATLFISQGAYLRYPGTKGCCCCTSLTGIWQPAEQRSSTGWRRSIFWLSEISWARNEFTRIWEHFLEVKNRSQVNRNGLLIFKEINFELLMTAVIREGTCDRAQWWTLEATEMASIQPKAVMTKQILLLEHTQTKLAPHFGISLHSGSIEFHYPCATRPASHQAPRK